MKYVPPYTDWIFIYYMYILQCYPHNIHIFCFLFPQNKIFLKKLYHLSQNKQNIHSYPQFVNNLWITTYIRLF